MMHRAASEPRVGVSDAAVALALLCGFASIPLLATTAPSPWIALAAPALLAGLATAWWLLRHPLANLVCVLALSAATIGFKPGIQLEEVVYGVYYLSYLGGWVGLRVLVLRRPIATTPAERALLAFLALAFGLTPLWFALGATLEEYISASTALANLAFVFPIREAIVRDRRALRLLVGVALFLPAFVALRNLYNYEAVIAQTVAAELLASRRVVVNDVVLIAGTVMATALASTLRSRVETLACVFVALVCAAALTITQSRMMWVMMVFGLALTVVLGRKRQRLRVGVAGAVVVAAGVFLGGLLLNQELILVGQAWLKRLSTLQSTSRDISFLSRLYEAQGALAYVRRNPVVGYGLGAPFTYFDILGQTTQTKTFIHNGYVALLYRFGLWGVVLLPWAWIASIARGLRAHRMAFEHDEDAAAAGFAAALVLIVFTVSIITSNLFYNSDGFLVFALMCGIACGADGRIRRRGADLRPPP